MDVSVEVQAASAPKRTTRKSEQALPPTRKGKQKKRSSGSKTKANSKETEPVDNDDEFAGLE